MYKDQNNYIAIQRKHRSGDTRKIAQVREESAKAQETWYGGNETMRAGENAESVVMRFSKRGNTVATYFSSDSGNSWNKIGEADAQFLGDGVKLAFASAASSDPEGNATAVSYTDITVNGKKIKIGERKTSENIVSSGDIPAAKSSHARIAGKITGLLDGDITTAPNVFSYASTTNAEHSLIGADFDVSANASIKLELNDKELKPNGDGVFNSIQLNPGINILKADVIAEDGITRSVYRWTILNTDTRSVDDSLEREASRTVRVSVPKDQMQMGTADAKPHTIKDARLYKGDIVTLKATPAKGYRFVGWQLGTATVSSDTEFSYEVGESDVVFNALFASVDSKGASSQEADTHSVADSQDKKGVKAAGDSAPKAAAAHLEKTGYRDVWIFIFSALALVLGGAALNARCASKA